MRRPASMTEEGKSVEHRVNDPLPRSRVLRDSEEQNPNPGPGRQLAARDGPHEAASS